MIENCVFFFFGGGGWGVRMEFQPLMKNGSPIACDWFSPKHSKMVIKATGGGDKHPSQWL